MMNSSFCILRRWSVMLAAFAASTALFAQPQDQASIDALIRQSQAALAQIDAHQAASVWDNASQLMRENAKRDEFVKRVDSERAGLGPIESRIWQTTARISYAVGNAARLPPGDYVNVRFLATDGNGRLLQELISFRLEDEMQWRMTGYVAQKEAAK
jgi:hypothetical protein